MMELRIKQMDLPAAIEFNYDELKAEVTERTKAYVGLVYTEDQIKEARKDLAMLRKFPNALSDERIRIKNELLKPYMDFEAKVKELSGIVDEAIRQIDNQVKEYDDRKRQEKLEDLKKMWAELDPPEDLPFGKILVDRMLNASCSNKLAKQYMLDGIAQYNRDVKTIQSIGDYSFEALEEYHRSFDLNLALAEGRRLADIQKRKEAEARAREEALKQAEAAKAAEQADQIPGQMDIEDFIPEEEEFASAPAQKTVQNDAPKTEELPKQWVTFRAHLTIETAKKLNAFFNENNIEFEAI